MSTAQVTRTETTDTTVYTATINGTPAAWLTIWTTTREVANIETLPAHQRQGLATQLWTAANADGECFHSLDHHRTPAGDAFAHAVGGDTIDETTGFVSECSICTADDFDDDPYA